MGRARRGAQTRGRAGRRGRRGDGRGADRAHGARDAGPGAAAAGDGVRAGLNAEGETRNAEQRGERRCGERPSITVPLPFRVPTSAFRAIVRSMRHLYLHVPFCRRRCTYCDFSIAVRKSIPAREYVDAVLQEVNIPGVTDPGREPGDSGSEVLETIYLGGGTPSLLPPDALATLLTSLRDAFHLTSLRDAVEVTLEANPEDVTRDTATAWRRAGINRVSLGAQSFDDQALQWMHRSHDAARIAAAVATLRLAGIDNISLDLIFALPAGLARDWGRDLEQALALRPAHLSLYGLTVEERTPLARWISRGATSPPDDERYAAEYLLAHSRLAACGYHFYEVSNA